MSDSEQPPFYFDIGETVEHSIPADSDSSLGSGWRLNTREIIENQNEKLFNISVDSGSIATISGVEKFAQDMIYSFLQRDESFSPKELDQNDIADLRIEFTDLAQNDQRTTNIGRVSVDHSERPYDNEVAVSIEFETQDGRYTAEFFIGDTDTIEVDN